MVLYSSASILAPSKTSADNNSILAAQLTNFHQKFRQPLHPAVAVDAGERALGFGQQLVAAQQPVFVIDARSTRSQRAYLQS